jgi:hypothetical protein
MAKKKQKVQPLLVSKDALAKNWSNPHTKKLFKQIGIFSIASQVLLYLFSQFGAGYQLFSYMFLGAGRFDDLRNGIFEHRYYFSPQLLDIPGFASVASPPMVFVWQMYGYFVKSEYALWASLVFTYLLLVFAIWKATRNVYATIFFSTAHPVVFAFVRGNPDMWVLIATCIAGIALIRGKNWVVAVMFGLMSALKFPFLLFGLIFIMRKDFKNLALQAVVTITAFLLPLMMKPWSIPDQINVFNVIVARYYQGYVIGDAGMLFNVSLFGLEKPLMYLLQGNSLLTTDQARDVSIAALTVQIVSVILLSALLLAVPIYHRVKNSKAPDNQLSSSSETDLYLVFFLFLALLQCLFPQIAAEYRLAQLVVIVALLYSVKSRFLEDRLNLILLTLIFLPKHFLVIGFPAGVANIATISSLISPVLLTFLAFRIQMYLSKNGFYSKLLDASRVLKNQSKTSS